MSRRRDGDRHGQGGEHGDFEHGATKHDIPKFRNSGSGHPATESASAHFERWKRVTSSAVHLPVPRRDLRGRDRKDRHAGQRVVPPVRRSLRPRSLPGCTRPPLARCPRARASTARPAMQTFSRRLDPLRPRDGHVVPVRHRTSSGRTTARHVRRRARKVHRHVAAGSLPRGSSMSGHDRRQERSTGDLVPLPVWSRGRPGTPATG